MKSKKKTLPKSNSKANFFLQFKLQTQKKTVIIWLRISLKFQRNKLLMMVIRNWFRNNKMESPNFYKKWRRFRWEPSRNWMKYGILWCWNGKVWGSTWTIRYFLRLLTWVMHVLLTSTSPKESKPESTDHHKSSSDILTTTIPISGL